MKEPKYNAFISYSHSDSGSIAPAIQRGIENIGKSWYKIGRNLNVFRDETNLTASPELWSNIEKALLDSGYFILFASPIAATSRWVCDEVNVWSRKNWTSEKGLEKILIVLTAGEIDWDRTHNDFNWSKTKCLPEEALTKKFKGEPLWIDLRPYVKQNERNEKTADYKSPGFTAAMTKIIGALTGKDPRDIESDELKRAKNIRRFLAAVTVVLISLLILSVILYKNANIQRKEAEKQRDTAEKNLKNFEIEKFNRDIRNGNIYFEASEFCLAVELFRSADSTTYKYPDDPVIIGNKSILKEKLDSCNKLCIK